MQIVDNLFITIRQDTLLMQMDGYPVIKKECRKTEFPTFPAPLF